MPTTTTSAAAVAPIRDAADNPSMPMQQPHLASLPPPLLPLHHDMPTTTTHRDPLEIVLSSDKLICRGVGSNYEPALLSGHVILNLAEATNVREITLVLTCKARLPGDARTSQTLNHSTSPVLYTHTWSFLPGPSTHKHTIKAGRHVFPFQHELDGSLPASITCPPAGAAVYYKLRATAIRSAFSANFSAVKHLSLIKAFSSEALEYNQTLEIENTWPGKIMYSIMLPHKAYAAGDSIPVLARFSPMSKGVSVISISAEIKEYVLVKFMSNWNRYSQSHMDGNAGTSTSRMISMAKFVIQDGKAVRAPAHTPPTAATGSGLLPLPAASASTANASAPLNGRDHDAVAPSGSSTFASSRSTSFKNLIGLGGGSHSTTTTPTPFSSSSSSHPIASTSSATTSEPSTSRSVSTERPAVFSPLTMFDASSYTSPNRSPDESPLASRRQSHEYESFPVPVPPPVTAPAPGPVSASESESGNNDVNVPPSGDEDVDTKLSIFIPFSATPSHAVPHPPSSTSSSTSSSQNHVFSPLVVTHKVKFSVILSNLDGHTSELRCALPIHVLDSYLLAEARGATRITRNLLFGGHVGGEEEGGGGGGGGDVMDDEEAAASTDLPSYGSHVLDRVANAEMNAGFVGPGPYTPGAVSTGTGIGTGTGMPAAWMNAHSVGGSVGTGYFGLLPPSNGGGGGGGGGPVSSSSAPFSGWSSPAEIPGTPLHGATTTTTTAAANHHHHGLRQDRNPIEFDQELLLSLGEVITSSSTLSSSGHATSSAGPSPAHSRFGSRAASRANSRAASRAPSPEPGGGGGGGGGGGAGDHRNNNDSGGGVYPSGNSGASRSGIFHLPMSIKPFSALTHLRSGSKTAPATPSGAGPTRAPSTTTTTTTATTFAIPSHRSNGVTNGIMNGHANANGHLHPSFTDELTSTSTSAGATASLPVFGPTTPTTTTTDPLSRVPSYGISSRGFLGGGVPPLQLYRDLPSYDQAEAVERRNNAHARNVGINRDGNGGENANANANAMMGRSQSEANLSSMSSRQAAAGGGVAQ